MGVVFGIRLPRALTAAFIDQALKVSEAEAGLSAAMRGLIAARTAVMTAVAAIDADMRRMARASGRRAYSVRLSHPGIGVYLPSLIWRMQFGHSNDAVLLVLASEPYDKPKYISDYPEFRSIVSGAGRG